jgi:predicted DNA-binding protein (UPF0251 family)
VRLQETQTPEPLSAAQVEALRLIAKGYRYSHAAHQIGIS